MCFGNRLLYRRSSFGLPKWLGLVIAGLMFYLVFFIIQIKGAMSNIKDEVSSDGIAGVNILVR